MNSLTQSQCRLGSHQEEGICWDRPQDDLCHGFDTNNLPWLWQLSFLNSPQYKHIHSYLGLFLSRTSLLPLFFPTFTYIRKMTIEIFGKLDRSEVYSYKLLLKAAQQQLSPQGNIGTCSRTYHLKVVLILQRERSWKLALLCRSGDETLAVPMLVLSSSWPHAQAFCVGLNFRF